MVRRTAFYFVFALIASCQNGTNNTGNNNLTECYRYSKDGDTITLKLLHVGESITGTLAYKHEGQFVTKGTILGSMQGDILVARYTIIQDGASDVKQVAFKRSGNTFIEGRGGTDSLQFDENRKLMEIECK